MYGALTVIPAHIHDVWCLGGWPLTRLATARNLAVCPGCACAVQVD